MTRPKRKPRKWRQQRGVCAVCGRTVAVHVPRGGDGSMLVPNYHHGNDKQPCPGMYDEARNE